MFNNEEPSTGIGWSAYVATNDAIGVEVFWRESNYEFGFGVEYSDYEKGMVETYGKYQLRAGYNFTEEWSVQLIHKSNCAHVCRDGGLLDFIPHGPDDKENHGYNFLSAMYRF